MGSPSATGRIKNEFHQRNKYSRYTGKAKRGKERGISNSAVVSRTARLSSKPGFRRGQSFPYSGSRSFVQRGRKNAYWGKYSKGERAVTTDIAGKPLRQRNFRSMPAGLVGRDTLKFFGRRPGGDRSMRGKSGGGKFSSSKPRDGRGWRGDVSGWKLRKLQPKKSTEVAGDRVYPRKLSVSQSGKRGKPIPGSGFQSRSKPPEGRPGRALPPLSPGRSAKKVSRANNRMNGIRPMIGGGSVSGRAWNNKRTPIDPRIPPAGAQRAGKFQGNIRGGGKSFGDQGEGFSGYTKTSRRPLKGGGSVSGRLWNNKRTPIDPRIPPAGAQRAGKFQGNIRGGRPLKGGGSVSGQLWNNKRTPIDPRIPPASASKAGKFQGNIRGGGKTFGDQGEGFSGYIKTSRKPLKGGGSVSGKLWNNKRTPIDPRIPPAGASKAGKFQGNIPGGGKTFEDQGEGFSGYIKTSRRPLKGGGSVSGRLWNNKGEPIDVLDATKSAARASRFSGNIKTGRPAKGGGSVSGKLWNNKGEPIDVVNATKGAARASRYSGNIKTGRPAKGGGSVSGKLWNNNGEPIDVVNATKGAARASRYSGNIKTGRPAKGGGSVSGKLWNNNEEPILVRAPKSSSAKQAGATGKTKMRRSYEQNPNASKESILKESPDKTTFKVAGLQIKNKRGSYKEKPYAADGSMKGIGPKQGTVKASEYARGVRVMWNQKHNPRSAELALDGRSPSRRWEKGVEHSGSIKARYPYRHNPNSADDALKVTYLGKAYARIGAYQGNTKMKKYNDHRLHPDAKFAHSHQDNVKEERTLLTNVKLFWSKLFKKSETQPEHLKAKDRRPRYDKREIGLWYD